MEESAVQTARALHDALNRPLHDLRVSVIDNCNMRCTYCMPKDTYHEHYRFLKKEERLRFDEISRLVRLFATVGVAKVRITGGEPLLRRDVPELVEMLPALEDVALTTNGLLLDRYAHDLRKAGLHRVTVSFDSLDPGVFGRMNGLGKRPEAVLKGIDAAIDAGLTPVKINVVVQRGVNDQGLLDMVEYFRGTGCILRFIEFMDAGTCNGWRLDQVVPSREVYEMIHARFPLVPLDQNYHGEVASRYRFEDGVGEIGFISSVTEPFCADCSRARLSADGKLYTCLFAADGVDLREPMRAGASDEELLQIVTDVWSRRMDRYSELRAAHKAPYNGRKVEMFQIGG